MAKITYNNKTALNPQPDIANENKVTSDDMNEIKQVVNTNDDNTSANTTAITNLQTYSTTEQDTGQIWINNKHIYRKIIEFTTPSSDQTSNWATISGVATGIDTLVNMYGFSDFGGSGSITPIQFYMTSSNRFNLIINGNNILYQCAGYRSCPVKIVLEYTKS